MSEETLHPYQIGTEEELAGWMFVHPDGTKEPYDNVLERRRVQHLQDLRNHAEDMRDKLQGRIDYGAHLPGGMPTPAQYQELIDAIDAGKPDQEIDELAEAISAQYMTAAYGR